MTGAGPNGPLSCAEVHQLAGELGLGVLVGVERGAVMVHLEDCESCRAVVEDMAELGDSLLQLVPEADPPAGFESRVLQRRAAGVRRGIGARARRRLAALAAAGVAVAGGAGVGIGFAVSGGSALAVRHPSALQSVGARELAVAVLSGNGHRVGQAFVYAGSPSWLFMNVDADEVHGWVTCMVETTGSKSVTVGTFDVTTGYRSWGVTLAMAPDSVRRVVLLDSSSHPVATATF